MCKATYIIKYKNNLIEVDVNMERTWAFKRPSNDFEIVSIVWRGKNIQDVLEAFTDAMDNIYRIIFQQMTKDYEAALAEKADYDYEEQKLGRL